MKKILVIDDEPQILQLVSTRLKANGYEAVAAVSGEQGLALAKEEKPDLIFLDHIMPDMGGEEVLDRLKKDPATKAIPVVIFTADTKCVRREDYQQRGAADCFFKPFAPEELLSQIQQVLERKA